MTYFMERFEGKTIVFLDELGNEVKFEKREHLKETFYMDNITISLERFHLKKNKAWDEDSKMVALLNYLYSE